MQSIQFQGLGTYWSIEIDVVQLPPHIESTIKEMAQEFEKQYSRFLPESEISRINNSDSRLYRPSFQLYEMLQLGQELRELTNGRFDLNISHILEGYGYDRQYSFRQNNDLINQKLGDWWLAKKFLRTSGPVKLDLGSLGKGYLIDQICHYLTDQKIDHFLVEGGGDLWASRKKEGPWKVAIEHPYQADEVIGTVLISNRAVCTSSPKRRQVGHFHHLLDIKTKQPSNNLAAVTILGTSAHVADACSTAFFVCPEDMRSNLARVFDLEYLVINPDMSYQTNSKAFTLFLES